MEEIISNTEDFKKPNTLKKEKKKGWGGKRMTFLRRVQTQYNHFHMTVHSNYMEETGT